MSEHPTDSPQTRDRDKLFLYEHFWRDHYFLLLEHGYKLRPRYHPDWIPSWKSSKKPRRQCEDSVTPEGALLDATRTSDGAFVMLKPTSKVGSPFEIEIGQLFSKEPFASDPNNRCIPILEVIQVPDVEDQTLLVMPLFRPYDNPRFDTIGEGIDFLQQIIHGVQFMHKNHVAHRDINPNNILMDAGPLFSSPFHPIKIDLKRDLSGKVKPQTRTRHPVNYYLIDFGLSRLYGPENLEPLEPLNWGGDKSVPEFKDPDSPHNPYYTDIYYLGNLMRTEFTEDNSAGNPYLGFAFLKPLIADMVQDEPSKRPTIDEVVARFEKIRGGLSSWKLRSRAVKKRDIFILDVGRSLSHWARRAGFIVRGIPSVPSPEQRQRSVSEHPSSRDRSVAISGRASNNGAQQVSDDGPHN